MWRSLSDFYTYGTLNIDCFTLRLRYITLYASCLQYFDTVGCAAGRASGPLKYGGMVEVGTG